MAEAHSALVAPGCTMDEAEADTRLACAKLLWSLRHARQIGGHS
jgi:hypothetical protein